MRFCQIRAITVIMAIAITVGFSLSPVAAQSTPEESVNGSTSDQQATAPVTESDDRLPFMSEDRLNTNHDQASGLAIVARTGGSLALIIGLLIVAMWCLKRYGGARFGTQSADAPLSILTTIPIGDRRALTVVRFGGKTLLIGSTPTSINVLASNETESAADTTALEPVNRSVAEVLLTGEADRFDEELTAAQTAYDSSHKWEK
ncbi:MAG: flagellar biosynthetic protein FliO [Acidobacteriota bacterium]